MTPLNLVTDPVVDPVGATHPEQKPRRRWRVDTAPLRTSRDFRLLWSSGLITYFGSITTYVALPFQMKELTGSLALAGLLSVAELVPLVLGVARGPAGEPREKGVIVVPVPAPPPAPVPRVRPNP